jgi:hypothetical protein
MLLTGLSEECAAGFLFGLLLDLEAEDGMFLRNVN